VAQPVKTHRHRFGIAKQKGTAGAEVQQQRQQDGAHQVNVRDGVEGDAAQHGCGVVTQAQRSVAVGGLVQGDREDHRQGVNQNGLDQVGHVHPAIVSDLSVCWPGPASIGSGGRVSCRA